MITAAGWERISEDPNDTRTGVERQARLNDELADKLGWTIGKRYRDNNVSGWKHGVKRPEFDRLIRDIEAGRVSAVVAYDQDRFARDVEQWARFRRVCVTNGVTIALVTQGGLIDFTSAAGGMQTNIKSAIDQYSSDISSRRIRDMHYDRALKGLPPGRVHYGWRRVVEVNDKGVKIASRDELHPDQAPIVQEAAARLLAGESLMAIARDLNRRGVPVPSTGQRCEALLWMSPSLRRILKRPSNVGQRVHRGEVLDGIAGQWPAILDMDTWRRVNLILDDPGRRTITDARVAHLLTNIVRCGNCGSGMRRHKLANTATVRYGYVCHGAHVCTSIRQDITDDAVTEIVLAWLGAVAPAELAGDDVEAAGAASQVVALQAELEALAAYYGAARMSAAEWMKAREPISARLDDARARMHVSAKPGRDLALRMASATDAQAVWDELTIAQRRTLITAYFEVAIMPAARPIKRGLPATLARIQVTRKVES